MKKTHPGNRIIKITAFVISACGVWTASHAEGAAPANDAFASAIVLTGASITTTGDNKEATTLDVGEPFLATRSQTGLNYRTVWWKWTAPSSGSLKVSMLGTKFSWHMLGVYVGTTAQNLKTVDFIDIASGVAELVVPVVQGVTYHICVGDGVAVTNAGGELQLNLNLTPGLTGAVSPLASGADINPSSFSLNDAFANAVTLTGPQTTAIGYNRDATTADLGEPFFSARSQTGLNYRTLWWKWTAPSNGSLKVSMQGTKFSWHMLGAYVGTTVQNLKTVDFVDQASGVAELVFPVVQGVTYYFCVGDGVAVTLAGGPVQLNLTLTAGLAGAVSPLTPGADLADASFSLNDKFANAIELSGNSALAIGYNRSATSDEVNEPFIRGNQTNHRTIWWRWIAPASGTLNITLQGTNYDRHELGVYVGSTAANLKRVDYAYSSVVNRFASVSAPVVAGVVYHICVGADPRYSGVGGSIQMNLSVSADLTGAVSPLQADSDTSDLSFLLNDRFENAVTLTGSDALAVGYHGDSTMQDVAEPFLELSGSGHTLWWKWTAPFDGTVNLSMQGTTFGYQMLGLYTGTSPDKLVSAVEDRYIYKLSGDATLTAPVKAGTVYYICVGSRQENINIWGNSILRLALTRGDGGGGGAGGNRPSIRGVYHGLYELPAEAGLLSVRVKKSSFTGHLLRGGQRIVLRGTFGADGRAEATSGNVSVEIQASAVGSNPRLSAKIIEAGKEEVSLELLAATRSNAISSWRINGLMIAPDTSIGHGLAFGKVSANGPIRFRGLLADGSRFALSAPVVEPTAGLRSLVGGFIQTSRATVVGSLPIDSSSGAMTGNLSWIQQQPGSLGRALSYRLQVSGHRWVAPSAGVNLLTGERSDSAFELMVQPDLKYSGRWPASNIPGFEPAQDGLSIKVNAATGRINGRFPGGGGTTRKLVGMLLPSALSIGEGGETRVIKVGGFSASAGSSATVEIKAQP
jgi:hypothetical protein